MIYICGPNSDIRTVTIELPVQPSNIGVCVSGGLDSALLFALLVKQNKTNNNIHRIVPLTVKRKEGSEFFANLVLSHLSDVLDFKFENPILVGSNVLKEEEQVASGVMEALGSGIDAVYTGLIQQLPQHMLNWKPIPFKENRAFKAPLKELNKSHIVDLVYKTGMESLFHITHSCCDNTGRCLTCNGCNERLWAFQQLGKTDPGKI